MSDVWEAGKDVMAVVQHYIANHHPTLASVDKDIAVLFKEKATKRGGQVVLGTSKKAPHILDILGRKDTNFKFIIEIAADEWATLTNAQQGALIDHLLCACRVEIDEETAELKCSIASPDVAFFWDELKRHGDWRTRPQQEEGSSADVEELLGLVSGSGEKAPKGKKKVEAEDEEG